MTECIVWGQSVITQCVQWATQTARKCIAWATTTSSTCCTWWPCSWVCAVIMVIVSVVCVLFAVVVSLVCVVAIAVVVLVCVVATVVEYIFCFLWTFVSVIFCMSNANGGTAFLLTDGSIMMQECTSFLSNVTTNSWGTHRWWKLTPDEFGDYAHGKWTRLADSIVARKYFASAVLADGRVLVCGGEYSDASGTLQQDSTNKCEIYDPVANTWSPVNPPSLPGSSTVWAQIGDAACAVLPDGRFLMGSDFDLNVAVLDPATLTWTALTPRPPAISDCDEESWVLMPNKTIVGCSTRRPPRTWVYDIPSDQWNPGNNLPVSIVDAGSETGPALLLYDGTAFALGANQHTATFSATTIQWSNGPDLPMQNGVNIGIVDGPAALLVDGNVLFGAAPIDAKGSYLSPCSYFEFDGVMYNRTVDPPNNGCPTYVTRLLLLPNGDVFFCREDDSSFYSYHPAAAMPLPSAQPVILQAPTVLTPGTTVGITGTQFNGLSQAVAYGDDSQTATNYPLVRITNVQSGHVRYCRTFNHRTVDAQGNTTPAMGVATQNAVITTSVDIPPDIELGDSSLVVVANGIPSSPVKAIIGTGLG